MVRYREKHVIDRVRYRQILLKEKGIEKGIEVDAGVIFVHFKKEDHLIPQATGF